jgi:hypothetical protein
MLEVGTWMHASRIIRWYLMKEPDLAKRYSHLAEAVRNSGGLYLPVMKVALETDAQKEGRIPSERLLDDKSVEQIKAICVEKIRKAAASGRLSDHSKLGTLLDAWVEWTDTAEARMWVANLIQSGDGIATFLASQLSKAISSGTEGSREIWYVQLKRVERFTGLDKLEESVTVLKPPGKNETQVRALKAFQESLDRRRSGKPDGAPWRDWDPN